MNVKSRVVDRVAFLDLDGPLTVEANTEGLHRELDRLAGGPVGRVVLDFGAVSALDASGVGQLVLLCIKAKSRNLRFELVNLSPMQRRVLGLVRLRDVLGVRERAPNAAPATGVRERAPNPAPATPETTPRPTVRRRREPVAGSWAPRPLAG